MSRRISPEEYRKAMAEVPSTVPPPMTTFPLVAPEVLDAVFDALDALDDRTHLLEVKLGDERSHRRRAGFLKAFSRLADALRSMPEPKPCEPTAPDEPVAREITPTGPGYYWAVREHQPYTEIVWVDGPAPVGRAWTTGSGSSKDPDCFRFLAGPLQPPKLPVDAPAAIC